MGYTLKNIKKSPFKSLTKSYITSDFGNRTFYNPITKKNVSDFHTGIDMTSGTTIVAVAKGKVTAVRSNIKGYTESYPSGNYVTLYHGNNIYTTYCHMKHGSVKVKVGDIVEAGKQLGTKGTTGFSTGDHLHFGVKVKGSYTDPKPYLLGIKEIPNYATTPKTETKRYYTVIRGDTLWGIAKKYYNDGSKYPVIAKANNIANPDKIYVGQKLLIP